MAYCITAAEYERLTYIKQIGPYILTCDRVDLKDETEVSPKEEAESLEKLEEIIVFLKKHLYIHSLRKAQPIIVKVKSGKEILFEFDPKYWDDYFEVLEKIGEEELRLLDEAKEREKLEKEKLEKEELEKEELEKEELEKEKAPRVQEEIVVEA